MKDVLFVYKIGLPTQGGTKQSGKPFRHFNLEAAMNDAEQLSALH